MSPIDPLLPPRLTRFNARWSVRLGAYRTQAAPPWWAPGLRLTAEVHAAYERYVPMATYAADLRGVLAEALGGPHWLPRALLRAGQPGWQCPWLSLADWWAALPTQLAGRVEWTAAEVLPLACALASPAHFGTRAGRYEEQEAWLLDWLARQPAHPRRVLDLGCGTGQGTWALAARLEALSGASTVVGVTREPLEAWMAAARRLPHHECAAGGAVATAFAFPPPPSRTAVHFLAGDVLAVPCAAAAEVILCNGLLGGPALRTDAELRAAWDQFAAVLRPGGLLLASQRFHAGHQVAVERFAALAPPACRCVAPEVWQRA